MRRQKYVSEREISKQFLNEGVETDYLYKAGGDAITGSPFSGAKNLGKALKSRETKNLFPNEFSSIEKLNVFRNNFNELMHPDNIQNLFTEISAEGATEEVLISHIIQKCVNDSFGSGVFTIDYKAVTPAIETPKYDPDAQGDY